ncbi:MAG: FHA domain-containing serine/threonine-protein kinase [Planctomycetota bacterium]|nr:FHA domain-containing serine/threonine-protein kinase [Planctomycetota bacterium]MDA1139611.1 FHA domain-containing serine/threonine-protein kinase [Planctomycetota bacterium]
MPEEEIKLIAKIVLKNNLASETQINECISELEAQLKSGKRIRLIDVLFRRGVLKKSQIKAVINAFEQTNKVQLLNSSIPNFKFLKNVGNGTAGTVYLAEQLSIGRRVAIKILDEELAANPGFIRNFQREAKSAASLNHPNVIQAIDFGESGGYHYFVMEYVDGESLATILKRERRLDESRVAHIGYRIASALQHAAKHNLIHRDVKPANIMLNSQGQAKLCDLGLARTIMSEHSTRSGTAAGTPAYMSPEQAMGRGDLDFRTDIFSLGTTLYHLLTGTIPFKANNLPELLDKIVNKDVDFPSELTHGVSPETEEVILKMMSKKRENRPETADQLASMLKKLGDKLPPAPPLFLNAVTVRCAIPPTDVRHSEFLVPMLYVTEGADEGKRFSLCWNETILGRHNSADIRLRDRWISRQQCKITKKGDKFHFEVLSKSSPMDLNGERVTEATLKPDDQITCYKTKMEFKLKAPLNQQR